MTLGGGVFWWGGWGCPGETSVMEVSTETTLKTLRENGGRVGRWAFHHSISLPWPHGRKRQEGWGEYPWNGALGYSHGCEQDYSLPRQSKRSLYTEGQWSKQVEVRTHFLRITCGQRELKTDVGKRCDVLSHVQQGLWWNRRTVRQANSMWMAFFPSTPGQEGQRPGSPSGPHEGVERASMS